MKIRPTIHRADFPVYANVLKEMAEYARTDKDFSAAQKLFFRKELQNMLMDFLKRATACEKKELRITLTPAQAYIMHEMLTCYSFPRLLANNIIAEIDQKTISFR